MNIRSKKKLLEQIQIFKEECKTNKEVIQKIEELLQRKPQNKLYLDKEKIGPIKDFASNNKVSEQLIYRYIKEGLRESTIKKYNWEKYLKK